MLTRTFNETASLSTGSSLSAYAYQGGTARVTGSFPRWPQSSYLRPHPLCRFGFDAAPLASVNHSRTEVVCTFAKHKIGYVEVQVTMSGEAAYLYGGEPAPIDRFQYEGCPAGEYAPTYADACRQCEPGKFQEYAGMSACKDAAHDEYVAMFGATAPSKCPHNTNHSLVGVVADAVDECTCMPGYYASVIDTDAFVGVAGHPCLPCDINGQGGNCTGGSALPLAKAKYWYDGTHPAAPVPEGKFWDGAQRLPLNGSYPLFEFYMCGEPKPEIKCPGGPPYSCGDGYVDRTCIACNASGLGRFEKDGECVECPETTQGAVFVLIAMCLIFVVVGLCFLIAIKLAKINVKAFASFSIGVRYWQVISTFGTLNLCWPAPVEGGFSFFNYIAFDLDDYVAQAACAVDRVDQMTKTVAYIVAPVIFMSVVFTAFNLLNVLNKINGWRAARRSALADGGAAAVTSQYSAKTVKQLNVCIHAFMYFLNLAYMMLARRVLAIFDCKYICSLAIYDERGYITGCKEGGGRYYLEVDPRMTCYEYDLFSDDPHKV